MNILSFFTFWSLFFAATTVIIVSFLHLNSDTPWMLDGPANKWLLNVPEDGSFDDWIAAQKPHDKTVVTVVGLFYTYAATMSVMCSLLIFMVIFLAARNRLLVLSVHLTVIGTLVFLGFHMHATQQHSSHVKLYLTNLALCSLGLVCCVADWLREKKKMKQAKAE